VTSAGQDGDSKDLSEEQITPAPSNTELLASSRRYTARRNVLEGGGWSAVGLLASVMLSAPLTIVLVRSLSARGYGTIALAISIIGILSPLATAGLSASVARAGAAARVHDEEGLVPVVRAGLRLSLLLAAVIGAVCALALGLLSLDPHLRAIVIAVAVLVPVLLATPLQDVLLGAVRVTFRPRLAVASTAIGQVALMTGTVLLLVIGQRSPAVLLVPRSLSVLVTVVLLAVGLQARSRFLAAGTTPRFAERLLPFGIAVMTGSALAMAISQLDVFVLGVSRGAIADASYAPVSKIVDLIVTIFQLTSAYLLPPMVAEFTRGRHGDAGNLYHWASKWGIVVCAPAVVVFVATPGPLLSGLYGAHTAAMVVPARILGTGTIVNVVLGFNVGTLAASGLARPMLRNALISLISSVALCVLLIPRLGAAGAAWATTGALTLSNILASGTLWRRTRIKPWNLASASVAAALGVAVGAAWALTAALSLSNTLGLICALSIGAVIPLSVSICVGGRSDLMIARDAMLSASGLSRRQNRK
jgi:O-antigen/teichoic acid export membrane protein